LNRYFNHGASFEIAGAAREIELDSMLLPKQFHQQRPPLEEKNILGEKLTPNDYFSMAEPFVSKMLVSPNNFKKIQTIATYFPGGLTDFLGFEVRLNGEESQADWALAISGRDNARYALANFLSNDHLPVSYRQTPEWNRILNFAQLWTKPNSVLHDKILGAWLEFDMPENPPSVPIPSVFFNPAKIKGSSMGDPSDFSWFTKQAIPSLMGQHLLKEVEQNLNTSLQKMPKDASLFIVGVMLSRKISDIRMSVQFRDPKKIIPYLHEIGWSEKIDTFSPLINDLISLNVNRIVLDFDIGKHVGRTVAVECSFFPNHYHQEHHWKKILDYLVEREIAAPSKRDDLLVYPGTEKTIMFSENGTGPFDEGASQSKVISRYITHIKIVYNPDEQKLKAKAYLAIRTVGPSNISI
jgi:hypothetical protein